MRDERTPKGDCEEATTPKESRHITCILEDKLSKCEVDVMQSSLFVLSARATNVSVFTGS